MALAGGQLIVTPWATALVVLLGSTPLLGLKFEFFAVGTYRVTSNTTVCRNESVPAASLGHCCYQCATRGAGCAAVNYLAATRACELLASGGLSWIFDVDYLLLLKVSVINDTFPPAAFRNVSGVLVQPGLLEGFTSYSLRPVLLAASCYSLCGALTAACRLFAFHSQLLQCNVYDVDFYDTWTTAITGDEGWTSYYAQRTGAWKLLYKVSKGINVDASNALLVYPSNETASRMQTAKDATCSCWLKNSIVDSWNKFSIAQVSLVLATAGTTVKYLNFSTNGNDTAATFFHQSKIVATSWTDLNATSKLHARRFEMGSPTKNTAGRYFLISLPYSGCPRDAGWLSVHGLSSPAFCSYDINPVPQFVYAPGTTYGYMVNASFADVLLLYAQL